MSRVDEALRRAAEEQKEQPAGAAAAAVLPMSDASDADLAALAEEPFSVEMRERRPRRAVVPTPIAVPAAVATAPPTASASPAAPQPGRSARTSLLERVDETVAEKVVIDERMLSASREQYRRLAGTLHHAQKEHGIKVIMVTSAAPREGKTLTSANLALTFSESYNRNVLLIDADLRRPALHTLFGLNPGAGLTEGLASEQPRRLQARQVSKRLAVLPAGRPSTDPMAALTSERMRQLLEEARDAFDWVIIDTPPVVMLPDANLLASFVDGALLVVKAEATQYDMVKRTADAIGRDRILGVVLNHAVTAPHTTGYGYYRDYGYGQEATPTT